MYPVCRAHWALQVGGRVAIRGDMAFMYLSLWEIRLRKEKRPTPRTQHVLGVTLWATCPREIVANQASLI